MLYVPLRGRKSLPLPNAIIRATEEVENYCPLKPALHCLAVIAGWNDLIRNADAADNPTRYLAVRTLTGLGGDFTPASSWESNYKKLTLLGSALTRIGTKIQRHQALDAAETILLKRWLTAWRTAAEREKQLTATR